MHPITATWRGSRFLGELRCNEAWKILFRRGSNQSLERCSRSRSALLLSSFLAHFRLAFRLPQTATLSRVPDMVAALRYLLHRPLRERTVRRQVSHSRRILGLDILVPFFDQ